MVLSTCKWLLPRAGWLAGWSGRCESTDNCYGYENEAIAADSGTGDDDVPTRSHDNKRGRKATITLSF